MDALVVEKLSKQFLNGAETRHVLKDVSFTLPAGRSLAIMGPSGCGKSTLLHLIGTLDTPTSGTIRIAGSNPGSLSERELARFRNTTIGFVFQAHHLLPQCNVLENVLLPTLAFSGLPREAALERAKKLLERVGLQSRLTSRPAQLSGGECQRVAVVRALINSPKLVLADEPTGSLDEASAQNIASLLAELKREENLALIVVTHTREVARHMDQTMILSDGVLRAEAVKEASV